MQADESEQPEMKVSKEEKGHKGKHIDVWATRRGAGTTPYQEKLDYKIRDFRHDASHYNTPPSIVDWPIQSMNPLLYKPNPVNLGKLVIELFANEVPRTTENFRRLCLGENEKELTYKGCRFHKIIPGFMMMTGDIIKGDGSSGESIYGEDFPDESFQLAHVGAGILTMMNRGKEDTNNSQFAILLDSAEWLDGRHVVFGKVVDGVDLIKKVSEKFGTSDGIPSEDIYIGDCGIVHT